MVKKLQWVIFTGVASHKGLIVGVKNHAGTSLRAHVQDDVTSWVHGGCWLYPPTRSFTQDSIWIGGGEVQADIVYPLWEGAILGAGACIIRININAGCFPLGKPVTKELKWKV